MSEIYKDWEDGIPPKTWKRLLAFDVGGATANALEVAAICPDTQSIVFYDEVHIVTADMAEVAKLTLPKLCPPGSKTEYDFLAKVGDYENKVALADMARHGIRFTNAVKQNKIFSVHRLHGYITPNPKRPYPDWHPKAGQYGAPLIYITPTCKQLISEIPQQKWKKDTTTGSVKDGTSVKDELDRSVAHDHVDCALYIARIMPAPATIPIPKPKKPIETRSLQSIMYWADVKKQKERQSETITRKPYNPAHMRGIH